MHMHHTPCCPVADTFTCYSGHIAFTTASAQHHIPHVKLPLSIHIRMLMYIKEFICAYVGLQSRATMGADENQCHFACVIRLGYHHAHAHRKSIELTKWI